MEKDIRANLEMLQNILKIFEAACSNNDDLSDIAEDLKGLSRKINLKLDC